MIELNKKEEIKTLIKYGFDLDLISFELDIPLKEIEKIRFEIEQSQKLDKSKIYSAQELINQENQVMQSKLAKMKRNYNALYFKSNMSKIKDEKKQYIEEHQDELVSSVIETLQSISSSLAEQNKLQRRNSAKKIIVELRKIQRFSLSMEQSEIISSILLMPELQKLKSSYEDTIDITLNNYRQLIIRNLVQTIEIAVSQTEDIQELKSLEKKLSSDVSRYNQLLIMNLKGKIRNKISTVSYKNAVNKIKNDIPIVINDIIIDIASGTLDTSKANEIIQKEARKRVSNSPKNKFSLTEEKEKIQILIQIRTALMQNSESYPIKHPEKTIMQLQELFGSQSEQSKEESIRTVINNLIGQRNFKKAKEICDKISINGMSSTLISSIRDLKKQIRNAEIGELVLMLLNMDENLEDTFSYLQHLEKRLKMENIKLTSISLGKSQDGLKNITLEDIWYDKNFLSILK